jgi:hypothetical protein
MPDHHAGFARISHSRSSCSAHCHRQHAQRRNVRDLRPLPCRAELFAKAKSIVLN